MADAMSVDQMAELILKEAKDATNPKKAEKIKLNVPSDVMKKMMASHGVDKNSLDNMADAVTQVGRAMHHAASIKLREEIVKNKSDKEFLSKSTVTTRGDLAQRIRMVVEVAGERKGMTIARPDAPSTEYTSYGSGKAVLNIATPLNEQREKDAKEIEEAYKKLSK